MALVERALFVFEQLKHTKRECNARANRRCDSLVWPGQCFFWPDRDNYAQVHTHTHSMDASRIYIQLAAVVVIENQISWRSCKKTNPKCMFFTRNYVGLCVCLVAIVFADWIGRACSLLPLCYPPRLSVRRVPFSPVNVFFVCIWLVYSAWPVECILLRPRNTALFEGACTQFWSDTIFFCVV